MNLGSYRMPLHQTHQDIAIFAYLFKIYEFQLLSVACICFRNRWVEVGNASASRFP